MMQVAGRKSLRLPTYDYRTPGAYFVTVCALRRQHVFANGALNDITMQVWRGLPLRFCTVELDEFIIMPDHVHGIVWLRTRGGGAEDLSLIQVMRAFKSVVATQWLHWLREHAPDRSAKIWQRGFYERIIRDDAELHAIRQYIRDNPQRWAERRDNLAALLHKMNPV